MVWRFSVEFCEFLSCADVVLILFVVLGRCFCFCRVEYFGDNRVDDRVLFLNK